MKTRTTLTAAGSLVLYAVFGGALAGELDLPEKAFQLMPEDGARSDDEPRDVLYLQAQQPDDAPSASGGEDLAKQLQNPVASLISVPFQYNVDFNGASDEDGERHTINVQPVVPISLNADWNLIVRTIVPILYQEDLVNDGGWSQIGLGDTTQSFFFSPRASGPGGSILAVGPVFLWPTATNDSLGGEQWGVGPTGLVLWQKGPWTYGVLANHIWSFAGDDERSDVRSTFIQPFLSHTNAKAFTVGVNTETTYDWVNEVWTVPINVSPANS